MKKPRVSIIIPTWNEEKNLQILLKKIKDFFGQRKEFSYELIIVDKYSEDKTVEIAKKFGARVLFDEGGKGSALIKGIGKARGDIIITMDADLSHRPIELGLLIEGIRAGYDIVMGSRFIQGGGTEDMPWYRKLGNKFFVRLVNLLWGTKYSDLCYGYRSFSKNAAKKLLRVLSSDGFGIETEISIKAAKLRLKTLEIPSFEKSRYSGKGKLRTLKDGWAILCCIMKELFSG